MKKLALALGIFLTATTAHAATILGKAYLYDIEIHSTPVTPILGLTCNTAINQFQVGMEGQLGRFTTDLQYIGMTSGVKIYKGLVYVSNQPVHITVACAEDGVTL